MTCVEVTLGLLRFVKVVRYSVPALVHVLLPSANSSFPSSAPTSTHSTSAPSSSSSADNALATTRAALVESFRSRQSTVRLFVAMLELAHEFDMVRAMRPLVSNDASFYKRMLNKFSMHPEVGPLIRVTEDTISAMDIITTSPTPMLNALCRGLVDAVGTTGAPLSAISATYFRLTGVRLGSDDDGSDGSNISGGRSNEEKSSTFSSSGPVNASHEFDHVEASAPALDAISTSSAFSGAFGGCSRETYVCELLGIIANSAYAYAKDPSTYMASFPSISSAPAATASSVLPSPPPPPPHPYAHHSASSPPPIPSRPTHMPAGAGAGAGAGGSVTQTDLRAAHVSATLALVLYDHVSKDKDGVFSKRTSSVRVKEILQLLFAKDEKTLLNAVQYSTRTFANAPESIREMFE